MPSTDTSGSSALTGTNLAAVLSDTLVARLTQASLNHVVGETAWGDSDSQGYTCRKKAREDLTGTLTGKFDTNNKIYTLGGSSSGTPGLNAKLVIWEDKTVANSYWVLPCALIQNYQATIDADTKEVVEWSMDYGADGKFYRPGQSGAPSETFPT